MSVVPFWTRYEISTYLWRGEWIEGLYDTFTERYVNGLSILDEETWCITVRHTLEDGNYIVELSGKNDEYISSYYVEGTFSFPIREEVLEQLEKDCYWVIRYAPCPPRRTLRQL